MLPKFLLRKKQEALPDLSRQYMDPQIPAQQRETVNRQLRDMYAGHLVPHFAVLKEVFLKVDNTAHILDAGCGSGYYSEVLRYVVSQPLHYIGCDYNPAMLEMAKHYYPKLPFARMDVRKLAWRD